jgi:hypothetical protein
MYDDIVSEYLHELELEKIDLQNEIEILKKDLAAAHRQRAILETQLSHYYL